MVVLSFFPLLKKGGSESECNMYILHIDSHSEEKIS